MRNKNYEDPDPDDPRFRITPYQQMLASCTGALVTSIVVTPLDVVKVRLQSQQKAMLSNKCFLYCNGLMDHLCPCPNSKDLLWSKGNRKFNGTLDAFMKISKSEGVRSLWSGLSPTLVLAVPATIVYFVSYEQLRLFFKDTYNKKINKDITKAEQPFWIPVLAGGIARIWAATLVSPLELIRTKMQSQKLSYNELVHALKTVVKYNGVSGLWMGLSSTLLRDVPFSAIYWFNYETIKRIFQDSHKSFTFNFIAGAMAGSIAALVTLPFDVVKTHKQIEMGEKLIYSVLRSVSSLPTWSTSRINGPTIFYHHQGSQPGNTSLNFESSMSPGIADDESLFTSHKQRTMDVARTYNNNFQKNAGHSADTRDDRTLFKSERRFVCFDTLTIQTYRSLNVRTVPSSVCHPEPPLRTKRNVFLTQKDLPQNMQEKEQSKIYPSSIDSSVSGEMNNETQLEDQSQELSESRVMVTSACSSWSSTSGSVPICTQNSLSSLINESLLAQKVSELSVSEVEEGNASSCTPKESSAPPFGKSSFHNLVGRSPAGPSMFTVSSNKTNVSYDEDVGDHPVDYSKKYVERNSLRQNNVFQEAEVNQSSKKEFSDKDKVDLFGDYAETDLDQPTDYSLRYAEDDTDEDEKQNSGYFPGNEQEDTVKTYCTEGTPYETPFNFSTATSMSDLCQEDSKDSDLSKKVPKKISEVKDKVEVPFKPVEQRCQGPPTVASRELKIQKNISELSSGLMSPEKPINYCEEGTPGCFSRVSSLSSLGSALVSQSNVASKIILEESPIKDEVISISRSDTRSARTLENRVPSATTETDGSPETKSDTRAIDKEGKMVTFGGEDYYAEQTPLMFSRCSSLGSLSGFEQHSIHDDRSSIISDFSRRTSGVVSPSELPDSPTQTVPPSPRHHKIQSTEFSARIQEEVARPPLRHLSLNKVQPLKRSVFEDDIAAFKEESTPIELSAATSLSSLTIDDEPKITKDSKLRENVERYKTTKTIPEETERDAPGSVATSEVPEAEVDQDPVSDGDDDDEDILAACISMGMQNNRYRQPFKRPNLQKITVPPVTTNLVRYQTSSALNRLDASTAVPSEKTSSPGLKSKSNVDVVVALDSVHIYCTEDTPAEISPVGSQSNLSALSMPSTPGEFTKIHLRESLQVEEQSLHLNELSDDSSNLSGDDEKILDECIQSGMPQIRQSTPPPTNCVSIANKPEAPLQRYNLCGTPSPSPIESAHGSNKTVVHSEPLPLPPGENENVLSDDSSNLSEEEAILTECIQSAMRKGRLSPPSKKSSIAPKETEAQIDGANLRETSSPPSSLVLLEPTPISTAQTKSELSPDGSSLSEDEDIILAQCIRSGMPKVSHTTRTNSS